MDLLRVNSPGVGFPWFENLALIPKVRPTVISCFRNTMKL